jgi:hypothetical protein
MLVSTEIKKYIIHPACSGSEIISSSRAILYYFGDRLALGDGECFEPFASIDSQTDHIKLDDTYPFALPSPRVSLRGTQLGALIGSSIRDPISPNDPGYVQELKSIFEFFADLYNTSVKDLLEK